MLPDFNGDGVLPEGIHTATWAEFEARFATNARRRALFAGLLAAARLLADAGCLLIFVDGSYTTSKAMPNDVDACWSAVNVDFDALDPIFLDLSDAGRRAMKARFGCEFFVAEAIEAGSGLYFYEFFQLDRSGRPKGIVALRAP